MTQPKKYSIIDIETTGGSARQNKITEIAIINMDDDKIVDEYSTLIFPERGIPPQIQYLTGITDEMVKDAPKFFEVAKKIVEMTQDRIFVAHNVHFDYNFIQNEFRDLGYTFKKELLCTVRLSRKILPGHASYSLGNLCSDIGIEIEGRHRAMGDAKATAKLFQMILNEKNEEFDLIYKGLNNKINLPPHLEEDDFNNLPNSPGVYYLWDKQGELLYIGKAKDIKKRVRQHFAVKSSRTKEFQFKNNIAKITCEETGNELAALLLEAHEIKTSSPLFNRALRRKRFLYRVILVEENEPLNFKVTKIKDAEEGIDAGSKRAAEGIIKKIYQKAFGIEPSLELGRSQEIELLIKTLGIQTYSEKLKEAYEGLRYPYKNFVIELAGRSKDETCLIERLDFGCLSVRYIDSEGSENMKFVLEENPDLSKIILGYMNKKGLKIKRMDGV